MIVEVEASVSIGARYKEVSSMRPLLTTHRRNDILGTIKKRAQKTSSTMQLTGAAPMSKFTPA
jgi:hypothetical protein